MAFKIGPRKLGVRMFAPSRLLPTLALSLTCLLAPLQAQSPAFQALHSEGAEARFEDPILSSRNKNYWAMEVHRFYSKVDRVAPLEEIHEHIADDVESKVTFVKTLRESQGWEGFAESLSGVTEKYPLVDRSLDQFEVEPGPDGTTEVRFRLTSKILKPESRRVRFVFSAKMLFAYRDSPEGSPKIVKYLARPSLSTVPKTLWERFKGLFFF